MKLSNIISLAAMAILSGTNLSAQDYFWFDDGGTISPEEGTVDQLDKIVIDYSGCAGTDNGLNIGNGKGNNWITSENGNYSVSFTDDYANHLLTLNVEEGPIVKVGDYKLTIPEGAFNVYGNPNLINDAINYRWTVSGKNDTGGPTCLTIISSYPAEGEVLQLPVEQLTLTFDQDVTVSHSTFNSAGLITNLTSGGYIQLNMVAEGNVITITKGSYSSSDFMAGQHYTLELYDNHIKAAADPSIMLKKTSINFSIAKSDDLSDLQVMAQIPAAGENIHSAGSVTFNMNLTAIDKSKISLVNNLGHIAELSTVGLDQQSPKSLIFNIDPNTHLQGNTTYKLHLEAGAVTAGEYTNDEMDAAYWCIPTEHFSFTAEMAGIAVPEFQNMVLLTESTGLTICGDVNEIKVTGVSTNASYIYAELSDLSFCNCADNTHVDLTFDKMITPALLAQGGAIYNSVKVIIPEGMFSDSEDRINKSAEFIVYVIEEKEIGEQTWTFNPASGSHVERLGSPWYGEDEEGGVITYYNLSFEVSGENVYARIPDGSQLFIRDMLTNQTVRTFERNSIIGYNNHFSLELGESAITDAGYYELVIPADAINLYYDATCLSTPVHPSEAVLANWIVGEPESITELHPDASDQIRYDLWGRQNGSDAGIRIINGVKSIIVK